MNFQVRVGRLPVEPPQVCWRTADIAKVPAITARRPVVRRGFGPAILNAPGVRDG
jgi:hypothetical protein